MFKKFASISSLGSEPGTGLLRAARAGNLDKVLEYLKANVDINTCNANGLNSLHLASKDGHINVVQELLERGASVDAATRKGNTSLHIAALAGQDDVVRLLVQNGANVNVQSQNGFTPLYMAAQENHDNVVKFLLANGANQSLATEDGFTPLAVAMQQGHDKVVALLLESDVRGKVRLPALHIAAKKDDCKAATLLLQNSANPDVTSKSNFTPLHIAAHYGNHEVAALLLDRGADVNFPAKHQITPLHVAAKWGKSHLAALLIERGANIDAKTRDGLTPLHCASRSGHEQLVDVLLEKGAPMSAKTKNGLASLHMAAQGDHVDAARILLYHKAPVDDVTVDYLTALHVAAHCGHVRVAKLLLDRKADPNSRALNGFTPLHIAAKKNRIKVVELLLKHGAQIEATTESGLSPLHVAAFMGCMNIAIFLLQNGAKPDATTVRGETPLHLAARANQTDIVRILLRNGANVDARAKEEQTPLHIAARLGNCDLVMLLLQHGASADAATKEMYTSLHVAAKEGQEEVAAILLDKGANVAAPTKRGFTPLHLAAKHGHVKVANLLVSKGAPVNAEGKNALTPLHVATHHDKNPVALMLLDNGADSKCVAKNGYTPLHVAAKRNQIDIATALIEYGADVNAVSRAGFTPVHLASQEGNADIVTLLIQHGAEADVGAKNGLRPLHLAAQGDSVPAANVLVNQGGASVDPATQSGYTPLHVASHFGQAAMVRYLLQNGADVRSVTSAGNTPLHHAAQQGQTLIITLLLEKKADPDSVNTAGQTSLAIAEKLGYVSVVETLKIVTTHTTTKTTTTTIEERYKVLAPESMMENLASDSEDEGTDDAGNESYRYLTVDDMKSLGDDSLPIDVTRDEQHHRDSGYLNLMEENIVAQSYSKTSASATATDNVDISRSPIQIGFLVSFMVDARGGAMRGCRHSGVRIIIPPRKAPSPMRITCRYLRKDRLVHPPPLMEGEALASRVLELGPIGVKFLGPVILEVPHFAALRSHEREIIVLRSDNGEAWKEHTLDSSEEALNDVFNESFDSNEMKQLDEFKTNRITRIVTHDFPQYFALVSRIRQEVHAVGPEGGMVSSSVVPQVQAVFPSGALTKRIKVGLQAHPISTELINKVAGSRVSVSPIVTVEPRRRKFHKPITLSIPVPKSQDPNSSLRLLCSITGGTTRAQWEDVTGSTPLTFVNDCVSFTTTVSARFWLVDCRHASHEVTRMATDLYREAIHVPFMAKFVIFAKRIETNEARLRVFCMTDDREEKTLEGQENFMEVAKSRDVEVLEGKPQWIEMAGNLAPVTKSGEQLRLKFYAFRENRLPFLVRLRDVGAGAVGRIMFMRESRSSGKNDQTPVCNLNIVLPEELLPDEPSAPASMASSPRQVHSNRYSAKSIVYSALPKYMTPSDGEIHKADLRISDVANLLGDDWIPLSQHLGIADQDVSIIETEYPDSPYQQATVMLRLWMQQSGDRASGNNLEKALNAINRGDIVSKCIGNLAPVTDVSEKLIAQTHVKESKTSGDIIHPVLIKSEKKILSEPSYDEPDIMKDSESLEDVSQLESARNKAKLESAKNSAMTSSYEREEQKYVAEEKEKTGPTKLRLVTWKIDSETKSEDSVETGSESTVKVERGESTTTVKVEPIQTKTTTTTSVKVESTVTKSISTVKVEPGSQVKAVESGKIEPSVDSKVPAPQASDSKLAAAAAVKTEPIETKPTPAVKPIVEKPAAAVKRTDDKPELPVKPTIEKLAAAVKVEPSAVKSAEAISTEPSQAKLPETVKIDTTLPKSAAIIKMESTDKKPPLPPKPEIEAKTTIKTERIETKSVKFEPTLPKSTGMVKGESTESESTATLKHEFSETESPMSMSMSTSTIEGEGCDTGISLTLMQDLEGMMSDTEGEVSELSLTLASPIKMLHETVEEAESSESDTVKPDQPSASHSIAEELHLDEELTFHERVPAQYVDKASSPVRVLDSDEETEKEKSIKAQGIDVSVGTDPKDARSTYVLTNLHDIATLPIGDSEIYRILQNQAHPKESRDFDEKDQILSPVSAHEEEASPVHEKSPEKVSQIHGEFEARDAATVSQESAVPEQKITISRKQSEEGKTAKLYLPEKHDAAIMETASQIIQRLESVSKMFQDSEISEITKIQIESTATTAKKPDSEKTPSPKSPKDLPTDSKMTEDKSKPKTVAEATPELKPETELDTASRKTEGEVLDSTVITGTDVQATVYKSPDHDVIRIQEMTVTETEIFTEIKKAVPAVPSSPPKEAPEEKKKPEFKSPEPEKSETDKMTSPAVEASELEATVISKPDTQITTSTVVVETEQKTLKPEQSFESPDASEATVCSILEEQDSQDISSPKSDDLTTDTDKTVSTERSQQHTVIEEAIEISERLRELKESEEITKQELKSESLEISDVERVSPTESQKISSEKVASPESKSPIEKQASPESFVDTEKAVSGASKSVSQLRAQWEAESISDEPRVAAPKDVEKRSPEYKAESIMSQTSVEKSQVESKTVAIAEVSKVSEPEEKAARDTLKFPEPEEIETVAESVKISPDLKSASPDKQKEDERVTHVSAEKPVSPKTPSPKPESPQKPDESSKSVSELAAKFESEQISTQVTKITSKEVEIQLMRDDNKPSSTVAKKSPPSKISFDRPAVSHEVEEVPDKDSKASQPVGYSRESTLVLESEAIEETSETESKISKPSETRVEAESAVIISPKKSAADLPAVSVDKLDSKEIPKQKTPSPPTETSKLSEFEELSKVIHFEESIESIKSVVTEKLEPKKPEAEEKPSRTVEPVAAVAIPSPEKTTDVTEVSVEKPVDAGKPPSPKLETLKYSTDHHVEEKSVEVSKSVVEIREQFEAVSFEQQRSEILDLGTAETRTQTKSQSKSTDKEKVSTTLESKPHSQETVDFETEISKQDPEKKSPEKAKIPEKDTEAEKAVIFETENISKQESEKKSPESIPEKAKIPEQATETDKAVKFESEPILQKPGRKSSDEETPEKPKSPEKDTEAKGLSAENIVSSVTKTAVELIGNISQIQNVLVGTEISESKKTPAEEFQEKEKISESKDDSAVITSDVIKSDALAADAKKAEESKLLLEKSFESETGGRSFTHEQVSETIVTTKVEFSPAPTESQEIPITETTSPKIGDKPDLEKVKAEIIPGTEEDTVKISQSSSLVEDEAKSKSERMATITETSVVTSRAGSGPLSGDLTDMSSQMSDFGAVKFDIKARKDTEPSTPEIKPVKPETDDKDKAEISRTETMAITSVSSGVVTGTSATAVHTIETVSSHVSFESNSATMSTDLTSLKESKIQEPETPAKLPEPEAPRKIFRISPEKARAKPIVEDRSSKALHSTIPSEDQTLPSLANIQTISHSITSVIVEPDSHEVVQSSTVETGEVLRLSTVKPLSLQETVRQDVPSSSGVAVKPRELKFSTDKDAEISQAESQASPKLKHTSVETAEILAKATAEPSISQESAESSDFVDHRKSEVVQSSEVTVARTVEFSESDSKLESTFHEDLAKLSKSPEDMAAEPVMLPMSLKETHIEQVTLGSPEEMSKLQIEIEDEPEIQVKQPVQVEVKSLVKPEAKLPEQAETKQSELVEAKQPEQLETKKPEQEGTKNPEPTESKLTEQVEKSKSEEKQSSLDEVKHPVPVEAKQLEQVELDEQEQAEPKQTEQAEPKQKEQVETKEAKLVEAKMTERADEALEEAKQPVQPEPKHTEQAKVKQPEQVETKQPALAELTLPEQTEKMLPVSAEGKLPEQTDAKQLALSDAKQPEKAEAKQPSLSDAKFPEQAEKIHPLLVEAKLPEKPEVKQPEKTDAKPAALPESKLPEKAEEFHPVLVEAKLPEKPEAKQTEKADAKQPISPESKSPEKAEAMQPALPESKSLEKADAQQPAFPETKSPEKAEAMQPVLPESKSPEKAEAKQTVLLESKSPEKAEAKQPVLPESKSPEKADAKQPVLPESKSPEKSEAKQPVLPESKSPEKAEAKQAVLAESKSPEKAETKQLVLPESRLQEQAEEMHPVPIEAKLSEKDEAKQPAFPKSKLPEKAEAKQPALLEAKLPEQAEEIHPALGEGEAKLPEKPEAKSPEKADAKQSVLPESKSPEKSEANEPVLPESKSPDKAAAKQPVLPESRLQEQSEEMYPVPIETKLPEKDEAKLLERAEAKQPEQVYAKQPEKIEVKLPAQADEIHPVLVEGPLKAKPDIKLSEKAEATLPEQSDTMQPVLAEAKLREQTEEKQPVLAEAKLPEQGEAKLPEQSEAKLPEQAQGTLPKHVETRQPAVAETKHQVLIETRLSERGEEKQPSLTEAKLSEKDEEKQPILAETKLPKQAQPKHEDKQPDKSEPKQPEQIEPKQAVPSEEKQPVKPEAKQPEKVEERQAVQAEAKHPLRRSESESLPETPKVTATVQRGSSEFFTERISQTAMFEKVTEFEDRADKSVEVVLHTQTAKEKSKESPEKSPFSAVGEIISPTPETGISTDASKKPEISAQASADLDQHKFTKSSATTEMITEKLESTYIAVERKHLEPEEEFVKSPARRGSVIKEPEGLSPIHEHEDQILSGISSELISKSPETVTEKSAVKVSSSPEEMTLKKSPSGLGTVVEESVYERAAAIDTKDKTDQKTTSEVIVKDRFAVVKAAPEMQDPEEYNRLLCQEIVTESADTTELQFELEAEPEVDLPGEVSAPSKVEKFETFKTDSTLVEASRESGITEISRTTTTTITTKSDVSAPVTDITSSQGAKSTEQVSAAEPESEDMKLDISYGAVASLPESQEDLELGVSSEADLDAMVTQEPPPTVLDDSITVRSANVISETKIEIVKQDTSKKTFETGTSVTVQSQKLEETKEVKLSKFEEADIADGSQNKTWEVKSLADMSESKLKSISQDSIAAVAESMDPTSVDVKPATELEGSDAKIAATGSPVDLAASYDKKSVDVRDATTIEFASVVEKPMEIRSAEPLEKSKRISVVEITSVKAESETQFEMPETSPDTAELMETKFFETLESQMISEEAELKAKITAQVASQVEKKQISESSETKTEVAVEFSGGSRLTESQELSDKSIEAKFESISSTEVTEPQITATKAESKVEKTESLSSASGFQEYEMVSSRSSVESHVKSEKSEATSMISSVGDQLTERHLISGQADLASVSFTEQSEISSKTGGTQENTKETKIMEDDGDRSLVKHQMTSGLPEAGSVSTEQTSHASELLEHETTPGQVTSKKILTEQSWSSTGSTGSQTTSGEWVTKTTVQSSTESKVETQVTSGQPGFTSPSYTEVKAFSPEPETKITLIEPCWSTEFLETEVISDESPSTVTSQISSETKSTEREKFPVAEEAKIESKIQSTEQPSGTAEYHERTLYEALESQMIADAAESTFSVTGRTSSDPEALESQYLESLESQIIELKQEIKGHEDASTLEESLDKTFYEELESQMIIGEPEVHQAESSAAELSEKVPVVKAAAASSEASVTESVITLQEAALGLISSLDSLESLEPSAPLLESLGEPEPEEISKIVIDFEPEYLESTGSEPHSEPEPELEPLPVDKEQKHLEFEDSKESTEPQQKFQDSRKIEFSEQEVVSPPMDIAQQRQIRQFEDSKKFEKTSATVTVFHSKRHHSLFSVDNVEETNSEKMFRCKSAPAMMASELIIPPLDVMFSEPEGEAGPCKSTSFHEERDLGIHEETSSKTGSASTSDSPASTHSRMSSSAGGSTFSSIKFSSSPTTSATSQSSAHSSVPDTPRSGHQPESVGSYGAESYSGSGSSSYTRSHSASESSPGLTSHSSYHSKSSSSTSSGSSDDPGMTLSCRDITSHSSEDNPTIVEVIMPMINFNFVVGEFDPEAHSPTAPPVEHSTILSAPTEMAIEEEPVTQTHLTKKTVRMANLPSADSEEVCPEVPLSGSYTFSEIPKRKEHIEKEALILDDFERQAELELASALERANEAHSSLPPAPLEKGEVDGSEKRRGERQYSEEFNTAEAKDAATKLVGEIESDVQLRLGMVVPASVPSSVEITDEELLSTGDVSSPEYFKPSKISSTTKASMECETPEGLVGVSSSSSEFFTAREDNTLKSSSDDTRPKSWDSSLVCQFPSSGSGSEYQTAVNPSSSTSSSRSYLGNLSSASGSGTLVASQIDLDSCMLDEEEEDEPAPPPPASVSPQPKPMSRSVQVGQESPNLLETRLPVTLTSSNSGTTVCTQVESTYESRVQGDPEVDDQDGNIYDEAELSALFLSQQSSMSLESPDGYERPRTPEPLLQFNEASQLEELFNTEYCTTGALPYLEPQHQLEDIEEEGSLKNSPKSVLSLEMSGTSLESSGGERVLGRPVSRESSSSLNEFERLESALLAEDAQKDPLLSEIEEGHESQVSEASDETEICGEEPIECEVEFDWDGQPETETGPILPPRQGQESPQFTNH